MTTPSKAGFTAGPWEVEGDGWITRRWHNSDRQQICRVYNADPKYGDTEFNANARLIAEAGTVAHETGLTPRQLAERCKELETALLAVIAIWNRTDLPNGGDAKLMYLAAHAAIAKTGGAA